MTDNQDLAACVKPLEWNLWYVRGKTFGEHGMWTARSEFGTYEIERHGNMRLSWRGPKSMGWSLPEEGLAHNQAAAQAEYTRRILSALIPGSLVPASAVEAARVEERDKHQNRVATWLVDCFGNEIASDKTERNHRFLEESIELVQATGCTSSEAHQLVDYVFGRDIGDPPQEVGGVMNTLAALCCAHGMNLSDCASDEMDRVTQPEIMAKIKAKQAAKPKHSPLPEAIRARGDQP